MLHYHIRWGTGELDWERHATRAEAEKLAEKLTRPAEEYTIEEWGDRCPACEAGPYREKGVSGTAKA